MVVREFDELVVIPRVSTGFFQGAQRVISRSFIVKGSGIRETVTELDIQTGTVTITPRVKGVIISAKFPGHVLEVVGGIGIIRAQTPIPRF